MDFLKKKKLNKSYFTLILQKVFTKEKGLES